MRNLIRGIASLLLLAVLLVGIPVGLVLLAGNPLPSAEELQRVFTSPEFGGTFLIGSLLPKVDRLLVGGGMLFTFLKAQGHPVAASLLEEDQIPAVLGYLEEAQRLGVEIVLPTDIGRVEVVNDVTEKELLAAMRGIGLQR